MGRPEPSVTRRYWTYRFLALFWMAAIYWLSTRQSLPEPHLFWGQDKMEHGVAFGILAMLFALSFSAVRGKNRTKRLIILTLLVALYGLSDEVHQYFVPGRDASFWDLCADAAGGFLAAFFLLRRGQRFSRKKSPPHLDIPEI
jgi:VanZ family protein